MCLYVVCHPVPAGYGVVDGARWAVRQGASQERAKDNQGNYRIDDEAQHVGGG